MSQRQEEVIEEFWYLLTSCPWWKMKIIKWLWPEIEQVSEKLIDYYWEVEINES